MTPNALAAAKLTAVLLAAAVFLFGLMLLLVFGEREEDDRPPFRVRLWQRYARAVSALRRAVRA